MEAANAAQRLFEAVAARDYHTLIQLYAKNARSSVISFLSMRSRWCSAHPREVRGEEKLDEFLQHLSCQDSMSSNGSQRTAGDDDSYYALMRELAVFLVERCDEMERHEQPLKKKKIEITADAERLLRDSSAVLSDSRPPSNFVVYQGGTLAEDRNETGAPPIFDGGVANATPAPLGGVGASGGAGTILHLACALDLPLALAMLLALGADARASHTAFRRLMIHEAACNGSIKCLTLLLELGEKYGDTEWLANKKSSVSRSSSREITLPFLPRRVDRADALAPLQLYARQSGLFFRVPKPENVDGSIDFLSSLRYFRECVKQVGKGNMTELDAARRILDMSSLAETSKASLAQSCGFSPIDEPIQTRSLLRSSGGSSDGHGNTPLHWAAFKNETKCVSLLLRYKADPNARAHPSGWTPLHDAAYSNSKESIELLINAGAEVDARANSGATPLCFAAQEDAAEAAGLLMERGADLTIRCAGGPVRDDGSIQHGGPHSRFSGYTPLHYCAHYNASHAAKVLLQHPTAKHAMEIPDLSDRLAIHVAVARGSAEVLRELLHAGARVETRLGTENRSSRRSQASPSPTSLSPSTTPRRRRPPSPESPSTPRRPNRGRQSPAATPVSSPLLRSMIPSQPVSSSKPWNCLTQRSIDECRLLVSEAEKNWTPDRHPLFTPADRRAVVELLRVGKHLELQGSGIFVDLWPQVLSFCGRGWFEQEDITEVSEEETSIDDASNIDNDDSLALPSF